MARRKQTTASPAKIPIKTESTRKNVSSSNTSSKKEDMRRELRKRGEAGGLEVSLICAGDIPQPIKAAPSGMWLSQYRQRCATQKRSVPWAFFGRPSFVGGLA